MSDIRAITQLQDADDVTPPTGGDDGKVWAWSVAQQKFVPTTLSFEPAGAVAAHVALADPHSQYELESANTAAAILTKLFTVDGSGSGLDADLLRGVTPSAYFLTLADDADASTARTTLGLGTLATANVPGSTTQVIYNSAGALAGDAGMTYDAANDALTVAGRVVTGVIRPASDSTTAVRVQNAAGSFTILNINSSNNRVGINTSAPDRDLHIEGLVKLGGTGTIYDNRNNAILSQSASSVSSARTLSFANGSYQYVLFPVRGIGLGESVSESDINAVVSFCLIKGSTSTGATAQNFVVQGQNAQAGSFNGGHIIIDAGAKTGSGIDGYIRLGATVGMVAVGQSTPTALLDLAASSTARASARIRTGTAPSSPNDGDLWYDSRLKFRRSSTTEIIPSAAAQSAYTQTFSTAARTVNAYTTDAESSAYTGIDNLQVGDVYATVADLNALRVAYENLRAMADNLIQVVNALIDDGQAFGMT